MTEFATIRRWTLNEGVDESALLALVRDKMIPAYKQAPGCLRLHLFRVGADRSYVAMTFWDSKTSSEAWAGDSGAAWRQEHRDTIARWLDLMSFREEFDAELVVTS